MINNSQVSPLMKCLATMKIVLFLLIVHPAMVWGNLPQSTVGFPYQRFTITLPLEFPGGWKNQIESVEARRYLLTGNVFSKDKPYSFPTAHPVSDDHTSIPSILQNYIANITQKNWPRLLELYDVTSRPYWENALKDDLLRQSLHDRIAAAQGVQLILAFQRETPLIWTLILKVENSATAPIILFSEWVPGEKRWFLTNRPIVPLLSLLKYTLTSGDVALFAPDLDMTIQKLANFTSYDDNSQKEENPSNQAAPMLKPVSLRQSKTQTPAEPPKIAEKPKLSLLNGKNEYFIDIKFHEDFSILDIPLENKSQKTLILKDIHSSCGCTVATPEKTTFAPGASGILTVMYKKDGREGKNRSNIILSVHAEDEPESLTNDQIALYVTIPPSITLQPAGVIWAKGEPLTEKLVRVVFADPSVGILNAVSSNAQFKTVVKKEGNEWTLKITPHIEGSADENFSRITIQSDNANIKPMTLIAIVGK